MVAPTYRVYIDLDQDEEYTGTAAETVTADTRAMPPVDVTRGRDIVRALTPPRAGRAVLRLDNSAATYDIGAAAEVPQGARVEVAATYSGTTYPLFTGVVDTAEQAVAPNDQAVDVDALGLLSLIVGRKVSTALYQSITTDVALGHLFDAAGYPAVLPSYAVGLTGIAGYWGLGESSGDALDTSGNGNDGTVTIGAGARDAAAVDDNGDGSITFDGSATNVSVPTDAAFADVFAGGGSVVALVNPNSDGEGDNARIVGTEISAASGWSLFISAESAGLCDINFRGLFNGGDQTTWVGAAVVRTNEPNLIAVTYDSDAVGNNPTVYVWNETDGFSVLTVGSGLTESSGPPAGAFDSDSGDPLTIGDLAAGGRCFDGEIDELALYTAELTEAQVSAMAARTRVRPRLFRTGQQTLDWWWVDEQDAFQAALELLNTEGPGAALLEDGAGRIVFNDRQRNLVVSAATTVQSTFRGATTEPIHSPPTRYDNGLRGVVNVATIPSRQRSAATLGVVWSLGETVTLGANETRSVVAVASNRDPLTAAVTPVDATDYTVSAGSLSSVTLDRTSGATITITLVAGGSGATVTGLQLRAQAVSVDNTTLISNRLDASASIAARGPQSYQGATRQEIPSADAQDLADAIVAFYQNGRPTVEITVQASRHDTAMTAALARALEDRVRVITTQGNIDLTGHIRSLGHRVGPGPTHSTTIAVEQVTVEGFILDTSTLDGADVLWY